MKTSTTIILLLFSFFELHSQHWQQFGNGVPGCDNFYLDSTANTLYATGKFVNQNGDTVISPAYWDGQNWITVGNFDFGITGGFPYKLIKYDSILYVGGSFLKNYGAPGDYILKLNNQNNSWDTLALSPNYNVTSFYEYLQELYIGGQFTTFGILLTFGVAIYYPPYWATIPQVLSGMQRVETMKVYNGLLILAGLFPAYISPNYKGSVVGWNGFNFVPLDKGLYDGSSNDPIIIDLEVYKNKLYAGGMFNASNVINGNRIVCWDGQVWSEVGGGINYDVRSLQVYNGELYAAGSFSFAGNIPAQNIAKWDGNKWCSLGSTFNGSIKDMCVFNNELIVSGYFTQIDGQPINHIAKWIGGNYTDSCQVVGIDDFAIDKHISIYPSLVNNILNIKSEKYTIENASILDVAGKIILTQKKRGTNVSLNVFFLPQGLYFLLLETKEGRIVKKFVKE